MRPIPAKIKKQLELDPFMRVCARSNCDCSGKPEWHHAIIYQGRQLNEAWAIVPLCHAHHVGEFKNDEIARHIAYNRASDAELQRSKTNWLQEKQYLKQKYEIQMSTL